MAVWDFLDILYTTAYCDIDRPKNDFEVSVQSFVSG